MIYRETIQMSHRRALPIAALLVAGFTAGALAQNSVQDIDYAILLSISEEVEIAERYEVDASARMAAATAARRHEQATAASARPAVPTFGGEAPAEETPEVSRAIQTATALRLRGETVAAAEAYARVLELSRQPIHAFFYAEVARANGDDLLADYLAALYREARAAGTQLPTLSEESDRDIRIAGVVSEAGTGAMLREVTVRVLDPLSHRVYTASTDANGLFVVDGLSRDARVRIVAERAGFEVGEEELHIDPAHTQHAPMVGTRVYLRREAGMAEVN